jgi:hypothetical protein
MDTSRPTVRTKANPAGGRHLESRPTGTHQRYDNSRNTSTSLNQAPPAGLLIVQALGIARRSAFSSGPSV